MPLDAGHHASIPNPAGNDSEVKAKLCSAIRKLKLKELVKDIIWTDAATEAILQEPDRGKFSKQ